MDSWIGPLAYVAVVGFSGWKAVSYGHRFSIALRAVGEEGPVGYDPTSAARYAQNPLLFFKEGGLTRSWRLSSTPHSNSEIEKLRVQSRRWTVIAAIATFVALPLL